MRHKMRDAHGSRSEEVFDLKHDEGGLIDVEFLIQYLVLGHSHDHRAPHRQPRQHRAAGIAGELGLIPADLAAACADSYRELRRLQHRQRLNERPPASIPPRPRPRKPVRAVAGRVRGLGRPAAQRFPVERRGSIDRRAARDASGTDPLQAQRRK